MSSAQSSQVGSATCSGSDAPEPRLSNTMSRPIVPSRRSIAAKRGSSHRPSTWLNHADMKTMSRGPSPTVWYAM